MILAEPQQAPVLERIEQDYLVAHLGREDRIGERGDAHAALEHRPHHVVILRVADDPPRADAVAFEGRENVALGRALGQRHDERQGVDVVGVERQVPPFGELAVAVYPTADQRHLAHVGFDRAVRAAVDQREVEAPVLDVARQLGARRMRFEDQLDLRVGGEEPVEPRADVAVEQPLADQHAIMHLLRRPFVALAAMRGERLPGGLEGAQVVEERHSGGRHRRPLPGPAGEQREAQLLLQRLDLVAHRSLRDAQGFRRPAKAAGGAKAGEDFQLAQGER